MGCHQKQLQADPRLSCSNYSTLVTTFFVFISITAHLTDSLPHIPTSSVATTPTTTTSRTKSDRRSSSTRTGTGSGSGSDFFHFANLTRMKTDEVARPSVGAAGAHRHRHNHRHHRHEPKIVRQYGLLSRCSNKHVQVTGKRVDSKARPNDTYALLRVETVGFGSQLRIQGNRSQQYLCFNPKGKLTVRATGGDGKCVFRERLSVDRHFTEFQSAFDERWFVAFNRNGRAMNGDAWMKRPAQLKCRYFMKTDSPAESSDAQTKKRNKKHGPDVDFQRLFTRLNLPQKTEQN